MHCEYTNSLNLYSADAALSATSRPFAISVDYEFATHQSDENNAHQSHSDVYYRYTSGNFTGS